jgi:2-aminoethylphosphonate-pyruvate transaminase
MGTRLQAVHANQPKGFVPIAGETIIARSLRALRAAGLRDFIFVTGWHGEVYREWLTRECPGARCVENADFSTTGSLHSLLLGAAEASGRDVMVVESDLLYETRAPVALLASPERDVLLVSGFTDSRDEVWVYPNAQGRLGELTKKTRPGPAPFGELVGLTRLSAPLLSSLARLAPSLPRGAHYEDGLNAISIEHPISLLRLSDLVWCEIDDARHLSRAGQLIWPKLAASEARHPAKP